MNKVFLSDDEDNVLEYYQGIYQDMIATDEIKTSKQDDLLQDPSLHNNEKSLISKALLGG